MNPATPPPSVFDLQSFAALKSGVKKDDPAALRATAQQFEAVFLQMVLKSMRAAMPQEDMLDNDQTRLYRELLDQQLTQTLSSRGGMGLAAVIERQLARPDFEAVDLPDGLPLIPSGPALPLDRGGYRIERPDGAPRAYPIEGAPAAPARPAVGPEGQAHGFVDAVLPHAVAASATTGIPAHFLIAHAALETGWGRSEPRHADGRPSHNLFGIKAGSRWNGPVVEAVTTEYVNGVPERRTERFRAYGSYAESFQDYARLLTQSSRYAGVLGSRDAAGFAQGLQRAGYATDPAYAAKLEGIIHGPTLRSALTG